MLSYSPEAAAMHAATQPKRRTRSRAKAALPPKARRLISQSRKIREEARVAQGRAAAYLRWELGYSAKEAAAELGVPAREVGRLIEEAEDWHWSRVADQALREDAGKPNIPLEVVKARLGLS